MKLVIAGDYEEYKAYLQGNLIDPKETKYVSGTKDLFCQEDARIVKIGSYWKNPVYNTLTFRKWLDTQVDEDIRNKRFFADPRE